MPLHMARAVVLKLQHYKHSTVLHAQPTWLWHVWGCCRRPTRGC